MANIKSAIKRVDVNERQRKANKVYRSNIKTFTKRYLTSLEHYASNPSEANLAEVFTNLSFVYSKIDKAMKKNILHKNAAARKKSNLRSQLNRLQSTL